MTQDEIIEMARLADFCVSEDGESISTNNSYGIIQYELEAFAKLVEDAAFKRWAAQTKLAVEDERAACDNLCQDIDGGDNMFARAIRARGEA